MKSHVSANSGHVQLLISNRGLTSAAATAQSLPGGISAFEESMYGVCKCHSKRYCVWHANGQRAGATRRANRHGGCAECWPTIGTREWSRPVLWLDRLLTEKTSNLYHTNSPLDLSNERPPTCSISKLQMQYMYPACSGQILTTWTSQAVGLGLILAQGFYVCKFLWWGFGQRSILASAACSLSYRRKVNLWYNSAVSRGSVDHIHFYLWKCLLSMTLTMTRENISFHPFYIITDLDWDLKSH